MKSDDVGLNVACISGFQPTGAVFKAATPKSKPAPLVLTRQDSGSDNSRPSSTKSDSVLTLLMRRDALKQVTKSNVDFLRSNSVTSIQTNSTMQKPKQNMVKSIQNVSVKSSNNKIVWSTNSEKTMSGNLVDGPFLNKMTIVNKQNGTPKTSTIATGFYLSGQTQSKAPRNTGHLTTLSTSDSKSVTIPIPIASKPVANNQVLNNTSVLKIVNPTMLNVPVHGQTPASVQAVPSFLVPTNQLAGSLAVVNHTNVAKTQQNVCQTVAGGVHLTQFNVSQPSQPVTPTVLTNLVLRPSNPVTPTATVVHPQQLVAVNQSSRLPAQIQYILPTVTMQTGPNKMQNVVQMTLPGAPINTSNFQVLHQPQLSSQAGRFVIPVSLTQTQTLPVVNQTCQAAQGVQVINHTPKGVATLPSSHNNLLAVATNQGIHFAGHQQFQQTVNVESKLDAHLVSQTQGFVTINNSSQQLRVPVTPVTTVQNRMQQNAPNIVTLTNNPKILLTSQGVSSQPQRYVLLSICFKNVTHSSFDTILNSFVLNRKYMI